MTNIFTAWRNNKKKQNDKQYSRPIAIGRWVLLHGNEKLGMLRAVVSTDPNFAHGEKLLQIFDEENKRYKTVAFIQDNGHVSMFKSLLDTDDHELVMEFQAALNGDEQYTVEEVHRDPSRLGESALGQAIMAFDKTKNAINAAAKFML